MRGKPFEKGHKFGKTRVKGDKAKKTIMRMNAEIVEKQYPNVYTFTSQQAQEFNTHLFSLAMNGNDTAVKIVADKLTGKRVGTPLGKINLNSVTDVRRALSELTNQTRDGEICFEEAQELRLLYESTLKALEKQIVDEIKAMVEDKEKRAEELESGSP